MPPRNPLTRGKKQKALTLLQRNLFAEAIPLLEQVCHADRRDAETWFLLAAARQKEGRFAQAVEAYQRVIALEPGHAEAHYYLGNTCLALGDGPGALAAFHEATRLRSDYLQAWINLGALYELRKNFPAAMESFRMALRLDPRNAELHYNLGNTLQSQEKYIEAVEAYRQALALRTGHADTYNNLGNALAHLSKYDEAIGCYEQASKLNPGLAAAWNNAGNTYARQGRYDEAVASYRRAFAISPRYAEAHTSMGNVCRYRGKLDEAIACHRRAIEFAPSYADAHFNLAFALLVAGSFHEGWQEYAWYWKREGAGGRPFPPSPWPGGPDLGGQPVFLHGEQGLGDEIFFLRFVPWLKRLGAGDITYRPAPKIAPLLTRVPVINRIATRGETPAAGDLVFAIGDLPRLLGMAQASEIPPSLSFTPLPEELARVRKHLAALGPPPYIGVTWRAGTPDREMVLYKESSLVSIAQTLASIPATVLVLQRQPLVGEVEAFGEALGRPAHDLSAVNEDLEQMLALLSLLDEYVGVSNTNMHLRAGAGKTARVLVPAPPEWRWMAEGKESPWFPGFSVYRQGYDGGWGEALAALRQDLARVIPGSPPA